MVVLRIGNSESGNIFAMLFAAVVMTGVLGVVGMQTVSGPITTITKVTQKNMIDTDLMTNARVVILDAGLRPAGGDGDADNYVEPAPFRNDASCTKNPLNGGCLPSDIGAVLTDPFGTHYGYCVWDHGAVDTSANRLQGKDDTSAAVIAVISAGADKTFQTECYPFDGGANEGLVDDTTSDDSVRIYTYDTAVAGANGLWQVKDGDPTVAQIAKNLEVGDVGAGTGFSFDTTTGEGDFPRIKTDIIQAKTGQNADVLGGLRLDDQVAVTSCTAGDAGVIRYNASSGTMEVCDGSGWNDTGENWRIIDSDHGSDTYVTVAGTGNTDTDEIVFTTNGSEKMRLTTNGDLAIGNASAAGSSRLTVVGGAIGLDDTGDNDYGFVTQGTGTGIGLSAGVSSLSSPDLYVISNRVGIGTISPDNTLHVEGGRILHEGTGGVVSLHHGSSYGTVGTNTNTKFAIRTNDTDKMTVLANGNVGIGITSPTMDLDVSGGIRSLASTNQANAIFNSSNSSLMIVEDGDVGSWMTLRTNAGNGLILIGAPDTAALAVSRTSSNVGIKIKTPQSSLHVNGAIQMASGTCGAAQEGAIQYTSANNIEYCDGSGWQTITGYVDSLDDIGDVDVAGVSAGQTIVWDGSSWVATSTLDEVSSGDSDVLIDNDGDTQIQVEEGNDDDTIRFDTAGIERMQIQADGDMIVDTDTFFVDAVAGLVGVGTISPTSKLEVDGNIRMTGTDFRIFNAPRAGGNTHFGRAFVHDTGDALRINYGGDFTGGVKINGKVLIGTGTAQASLDVAGTDAILFPRGTNANRPSSPVNGMMRYNTGAGKYEAYQSGAWQDILTSAVGNVASSMEDQDGDTWIRVSADNGSDNDTIRMATNGTVGLTIQSDGNIVVPTGKGIGNSFVPADEHAIYPHAPLNGMTQLGASTPYSSGVLVKSDAMIGFGETDANALVGYMDVNNDAFVWDGSMQSQTLTVTNAEGIAWEGGVNKITHNDGGGNVQIRFGNDYTSSDERFTHGGGAMYIGGNIDATSNTTMSLKVSSNAGAGDNQAVAWGSSLDIGANSITFGGVDLTNTDGGDADTLDGLNSTQFLRSDADDSTTGRLGVGSGDRDGTLTITGAPDISAVNTAGQGGLVIQDNAGNASGTKMRVDANEIQVSANGSPSTILINPFGGNIDLGNATTEVDIDGTLDMTSGKIKNVLDPTDSQDAATKAYVDAANVDRVDGLHASQFIRSDADDNVTAHTEWQDSYEIRLGSGADFRMDFNGTDTYMRSYAHGARWLLQGENAGGTNRNMIVADPDAAVDIRYAGVTRLATRPDGINVTDHIFISGNQAMRGNDNWLRLNQNGDFTNGTYTPGMFRADGGFEVDGNTIINGSGTVIGSYVGSGVNGDNIANGTIDSSEIQDNTLTANDLAPDSVGSSEIANNAVGSSEIANGAVGNSEIANNAVNSAKIANGSVTSDDIANNTITAADIGTGAVRSDEILNGTIGLHDLSASGTRNSSRFLRGDNTWAPVNSTPSGKCLEYRSNRSGEMICEMVVRTASGAGPCWSGGCDGGYGTPAACPSGYVSVGTDQACNNPNDYKESAIRAFPSRNYILGALFYFHNGWGCSSGWRLGYSVRYCRLKANQ